MLCLVILLFCFLPENSADDQKCFFFGGRKLCLPNSVPTDIAKQTTTAKNGCLFFGQSKLCFDISTYESTASQSTTSDQNIDIDSPTPPLSTTVPPKVASRNLQKPHIFTTDRYRIIDMDSSHHTLPVSVPPKVSSHGLLGLQTFTGPTQTETTVQCLVSAGPWSSCLSKEEHLPIAADCNEPGYHYRILSASKDASHNPMCDPMFSTYEEKNCTGRCSKPTRVSPLTEMDKPNTRPSSQGRHHSLFNVKEHFSKKSTYTTIPLTTIKSSGSATPTLAGFVSQKSKSFHVSKSPGKTVTLMSSFVMPSDSTTLADTSDSSRVHSTTISIPSTSKLVTDLVTTSMNKTLVSNTTVYQNFDADNSKLSVGVGIGIGIVIGVIIVAFMLSLLFWMLCCKSPSREFPITLPMIEL